MNSKTVYWVWLSQVIGVGGKTSDVFGAFTDPEELYRASANERMMKGVFTEAQFKRAGAIPLKKAENIMRVCEQNGWGISTPDDDDFPSELRGIENMPVILYVDGDLSKIKNKLTIGMVGTRKPTYEGACIARTMASDLARAGVAVISGGALGIDGASHEGVLDVGGTTVCVLGCGLGTKYLKTHEHLRERIKESGAVVTEYEPFINATKFTFPTRNRIISGISKGVIVVEAGSSSGSLITAKHARAQGKDLLAIPGNVFESAHMGCNKLIMSGARAVTNAADVLQPYSIMYPELVDAAKIQVTKPVLERPKEKKPVKIKKEAPPTLDPDALAVYNLFGEEPLYADDISAELEMSTQKVNSSLVKLEIDGLIKQLEGKKFILK